MHATYILLFWKTAEGRQRASYAGTKPVISNETSTLPQTFFSHEYQSSGTLGTKCLSDQMASLVPSLRQMPHRARAALLCLRR